MLVALGAMHPRERGWVFLPELRIGTGFGRLSEQRLDAWAIQGWTEWVHPEKDDDGDGRSRKIKNLRRAFEIKVNRSDARAELLNPDKRWFAQSVSNQFYFVAPVGVIAVDELGPNDGLIVWADGKLRVARKARLRSAMPPRWSFVAAIARRVQEMDVRRGT